MSADRIIVNKVDLVDEDTVERIEHRIRKLNQRSEIDRSSYAEVNLDAILGIQAFEISQRAASEPSFLENHFVHSHDPDVETFSMRIVGELDRELVEAAAHRIASDHGADLLRWKGVLAIAGNDRRVALQGVHRIFEVHDLDRWQGPHRDSRVVFIGKDLDRDRLAGCLQVCVVDSQGRVGAT